jgi:hypothetical protein
VEEIRGSLAAAFVLTALEGDGAGGVNVQTASARPCTSE